MQRYFLERCSSSLVRAYTPAVVHFSTVPSNPPGENISNGGPAPITSYRVLMPSTTTLGRALSFQMASGANVLGIGGEGVERYFRDVGVALGLGFERARRVADGGVRHAHAPVQPRPAAEPADHRDAHGTH